MSQDTSQPQTYTITVPQNSAWEPYRAQQFIEQMLVAFGTLIFRIIATYEQIVWQLVDLFGFEPTAIMSAIHSSYPEADVQATPYGTDEFPTSSVFRLVLKYQYKINEFVAPLQYVSDLRGPDPLAALTHAMSALQRGERILYTVVIAGFATGAYKEGEKLIVRPIYDGSLLGLAFPVKIDRYVPELQRVLVGKLQQRLYHTYVTLQMESPQHERIQSLLVVDNQMVGFDRPNFNGLCWLDDPTTQIVSVNPQDMDADTSALGTVVELEGDEHLDAAHQKLKKAIRLIMEPRELASLWHLPHRDCTAPTITWSYPQVRLPARMVGVQHGICLGVNDYAGTIEPVYLPLSDRTGHMSIIGKAGVGKSTLMHQLVHQDIANNRGVMVLDPHGTLVCDVLRHSIPTHREQDVVVLDLANEDYPPPMNLLAVPEKVDAGTAAGRVMAVLNTLYEDFHETPTIADTLWTSLVTLRHENSPTIRDVVRLLTDPAYRTRFLAQVDNPAAQEFWERYERMSIPQQEQLVRPVAWRLRSFYGNSALYPALCHLDRLDLSALIAQNKIILISLKADEARIPAREQRLLGLSLLSQIQLAVMTRPVGSPTSYLYVDEAQYFVTSPLESVLAEARKFGLSLILANQYLKQLTGTMLDAIMGNIGAMVVFQCGLDDAKALAPYMAPGFDTERLINLHKFNAAVKVRFQDETQTAFSLKTSTPIIVHKTEAQALAREHFLRDLSRQHYTPKCRQEIMDWLKQRYPLSGKPGVSHEPILDSEPLN